MGVDIDRGDRLLEGVIGLGAEARLRVDGFDGEPRGRRHGHVFGHPSLPSIQRNQGLAGTARDEHARYSQSCMPHARALQAPSTGRRAHAFLDSAWTKPLEPPSRWDAREGKPSAMPLAKKHI